MGSRVKPRVIAFTTLVLIYLFCLVFCHCFEGCFLFTPFAWFCCVVERWCIHWLSFISMWGLFILGIILSISFILALLLLLFLLLNLIFFFFFVLLLLLFLLFLFLFFLLFLLLFLFFWLLLLFFLLLWPFFLLLPVLDLLFGLYYFLFFINLRLTNDRYILLFYFLFHFFRLILYLLWSMDRLISFLFWPFRCWWLLNRMFISCFLFLFLGNLRFFKFLLINLNSFPQLRLPLFIPFSHIQKLILLFHLLLFNDFISF